MKTYKGKYKPKNLKKYRGDYTKITYRSLWERQTFRWIDGESSIVEWNSEEVIIPYRCQTDGKMHRYFIDVYFKTAAGKKYLIEIKPDKQTRPPTGTKRSKRFITESLTYIKNQCKWEAATKFASDNNCTFQIWTEHTLEGLGIKLLTKQLPKTLRPTKVRRKKKKV
jgi:hypothetical protein